MKDKKEVPEPKNLTWFIPIAVIVLLIVIFFGAKIFLFIHFIFGNDIVVKLSVDKEFLSVVRGQEKNVTFKASVTTNPFCTATCKSEFRDISADGIVNQSSFILKPGSPFRKEYPIKITGLGDGQELYQFSMECHSVSTILCQTDEEPTIRTVLLTVEYNLSKEEKQLKSDLKQELVLLTETLADFSSKQNALDAAVNELDKLVYVDELKNNNNKLKNSISFHITQLTAFNDLWQEQDYYQLSDEVNNLNKKTEVTEKEILELNKTLSDDILAYNNLIEQLIELKERLEQLKNQFIANQKIISEIDDAINEFNDTLNSFKEKNSLQNKENLIGKATGKITKVSSSVQQEIKTETIKHELELYTEYDALCQITGLCTVHPSIKELSNKTFFDLNHVCNDADKLKQRYSGLDIANHDAFNRENYPGTGDFWNNISLKIKNIKQSITRNYLEQVPENGTNSELIKQSLTIQNFYETEDYAGYNLTPALISELIKQQPGSCEVNNFEFANISDIDIGKIEMNETVAVNLGINFPEPKPKCCVFGRCSSCCASEECRDEPKNYPVVFLHGHSLNKEVSPEYSLDAFNKMQKKLEEDGYVSAGAVSLYTSKETPYGAWGLFDAPLTIKVSYYFDIFKEPENYVVVQTKSENIDTYAVRLKELIQTVSYNTGRPKVIIIAHSMGGLVARRYIQIFGAENVEKLILIAVPNKGITGKTADYCDVIGSKLECNDMNSDNLFINKLNQGGLPGIPIYNIVGTGCNMPQGVGDGIVLEKNAWLEGADNTLVNGTCKQFSTLHTKILDIDLYPEVYELIYKALKE